MYYGLALSLDRIIYKIDLEESLYLVPIMTVFAKIANNFF